MNVPIAGSATRDIARTTFALIMLAIAAAVALFSSSMGVYGVISGGVSLRTCEIGVRMALGANRADVSRLVLKRSLLLERTGIPRGVVVLLGLTRFLSAMWFGADPRDPVTFMSVPAILGLAAPSTSCLPARRASHAAPIDALRQ